MVGCGCGFMAIVTQHRSPIVRSVVPGKTKSKAGMRREGRSGSKQAAACSRCWADRRGRDRCRHARNPLAAALDPRLLRRCGTQEARPRSPLGERRRWPGLSHRLQRWCTFRFPPFASSRSLSTMARVVIDPAALDRTPSTTRSRVCAVSIWGSSTPDRHTVLRQPAIT